MYVHIANLKSKCKNLSGELSSKASVLLLSGHFYIYIGL